MPRTLVLKTVGKREGQYAFKNRLTSEIRYNVLSKSVLNFRFSFVKILYNEAPNTPVSFAMLEGLQPGENLLWNLSYEKKMANNIQLSLSYDGRKTGKNAKVIHIGRAQVRALF